MKRIYRFICSCIRLRSFSRAVWVFRMDNHKPKF